MKTRNSKLALGIVLGVVIAGAVGWAAAGVPGAPDWMQQRMGMTDRASMDHSMGGGMGSGMTGHCSGCGGTGSSGSASGDVAISDLSYEPQTLRIRVGDTVTWANQDPYEHTVTSDDGFFDSGLLPTDATWSFTFSQPGTYRYHCQPHSSQNAQGVWQGQVGTIVVDP
jgi:plastocyanin